MHSQKLNSPSFPAKLTCLVLGLSSMIMPGLSQASWKGTANDLKLLPRYCKDTMSFPENYQARQAYWVNVMGKTFQHMHHYCWALNEIQRSQRANIDRQARIGLWQEAANNYEYVIKNAEPDFVLLPEIYTRLGEVELLRNLPAKANQAFSMARELKPDYWPAYSRWAEYLMRNSQRAEALRIVTSGLQYSPDAKILRELFQTLGGKLSDIPAKPAEKTVNDAAATAQDSPVEKGEPAKTGETPPSNETNRNPPQ